MIEQILNNIPAHICALIGFIFLVISTQVKTRKKVLLFQSLFSLFFFLQYLLLKVYSASFLCLFGLIRNITYYYKNNKTSSIIIIILTTIIGILTGLYDLKTYNILIAFTPTIINIMYSYILSKNNIINIKKIFLICSIIWVIYDYFVKAYVGLICNSIEMLSYIYYFINTRRAK